MRQAGFSLLEMLVALVVLAIASASVVMALQPDPQRLARDEAERLALLLDLAGEEADLGGQSLAWVAKADGYEFQRRQLDDRGGVYWTPLAEDELLHPRRLPPGVALGALEQDGRPRAPGERILLQPAPDLRIELVQAGQRLLISNAEPGTTPAYRVEAP